MKVFMHISLKISDRARLCNLSCLLLFVMSILNNILLNFMFLMKGHFGTQVVTKPKIFLLITPEYWDYKYLKLCLATIVLVSQI